MASICLGLNVLTHWPLGYMVVIWKVQFWNTWIKFMSTSCEIVLRWMPHTTCEDKSTSVNGLVPSGNKPLPEPIFTKFYVAMWRHQVTMSKLIFPFDKMATILETTFLNVFWNFVFWFEFHWSLFLMVQLTVSHHWFRFDLTWCQTGSKPWASYQLLKIVGCACAGNAGDVFPATAG